MFKKIEELHDHKTNEGFYPLTHVQAVIDNDEIDLETKLNQINNDISSKVTDYSKQYLTTVARENGTISFVISSGINTNLLTSISYSTDRGKTWITTNNTDNKAEDIQIDVNVSEGDEVMWKGIGLALGDDNDNASNFVTNIPIDVEGNIMSLLYGDNFIGQTSLADGNCNFLALFGEYVNSGADVVDASDLILPTMTLAYRCYSNMFMGCTSLTQAPALPATILADWCYADMFYGCTSLIQAPVLPATTLTSYCYDGMFDGCTALTQAPELPATTLADYCYYCMFKGCTSLTKAPELPATTLADYCYQAMFNGCTALTQASALPAMTLANGCYQNMFQGCTSLTQPPTLPATTLASRCYSCMFQKCTALTQAPVLPATTLAAYCYEYMFKGCTSLTQAPELPATTLADACYYGMFEDCTSLTQAPELPATTLAEYCYYDMFNICRNLSSITCLATDISANRSTTSWLYHVASTGTFAKPASMTSWTNGISGIPNGWTTVDCIATTPTRYLTFRAGSDNSSFGLKTIATDHKVYYGTDLQYWKLLDTEKDIEINDGEEVYVIGDSDGVTFSTTNNTTFRMSGAISVTGDITSILDYKTLTEKIAPYCYYQMFSGCTSLTQAPTLSATTLANNCCMDMFSGCTSLTQASTLPATTLADYCYGGMFSGCTLLTQAPELPATSLAGGCYAGMFHNCTSLTQAPALPATTLKASCYDAMFRNCTALTQSPALPATTLKTSCYYQMFYGCTSLTQSPTLPATALANQCYRDMFNGCSNLSFVICLATDISASMATTDWLSNVAATGTFIIPDNSPVWSRDANGIPSSWNVYTKSGYEVVRHQELYSNISITPFISKQQKINNKSINQILIPIDSSKNNYSGDNLSDTTIITYISDNENYLVLELGNVIEENYVIIEANLIGQGFYSNANILYNNGVVQIYSALPLNSIKDNLEYLFISYYISDTSGCGCGCGTTPDSPDPTPVPDPTPTSSE